MRGPPPEPSEAVPVGRGGARERAQFSAQRETETSGLCADEVHGVHPLLLPLRQGSGLVHLGPVVLLRVLNAVQLVQDLRQLLVDGSKRFSSKIVHDHPFLTYTDAYRSRTSLFFGLSLGAGGGRSSTGGVSERSSPSRLCRAPTLVTVISLTHSRSQGSCSAMPWVKKIGRAHV